MPLQRTVIAFAEVIIIWKMKQQEHELPVGGILYEVRMSGAELDWTECIGRN